MSMQQDPADYPVKLEIPYPEMQSKALAVLGALFFLKALLLVPHYIVLYFLNIAAFVAVYIGYWTVIVTGKQPRGLFDFVANVLRWQTRATAWLYSLTDKYPPFTLQ